MSLLLMAGTHSAKVIFVGSNPTGDFPASKPYAINFLAGSIPCLEGKLEEVDECVADARLCVFTVNCNRDVRAGAYSVKCYGSIRVLETRGVCSIRTTLIAGRPVQRVMPQCIRSESSHQTL